MGFVYFAWSVVWNDGFRLISICLFGHGNEPGLEKQQIIDAYFRKELRDLVEIREPIYSPAGGACLAKWRLDEHYRIDRIIV